MREIAKQSESVVQNSSVNTQDIAIIGVACRLPGGIRNKEAFWELLASGKDAITTLPAERWQWPADIDPDHTHKGIDHGAFLSGIDEFDAPFFRISPKEAELMDPQQRILLELSWECLEDAGCPAKDVSGSNTGVFIGASGSDYIRFLEKNMQTIEAHSGIGTSMAVLPNRISYFYDLHGPSLHIDTACSSSLVAVHQAVQALRAAECGQAFVGGINILCHPANSIAYYKAGMLSHEGHCKSFDKSADGYVRGEGAVMMLFKPLHKALVAQDRIYAVIKGSAVNHGGQAGGLTVPNPAQQADVIVNACHNADVRPDTIGYIEAHGTGTPLGDPIEMSGLQEAFARLSDGETDMNTPYCGLGSVKTNIGHLEAAAGLASLLKAVLSLRHHTLPASLHFTQLNPQITLAPTPFYIVDKNQPWQLPPGQSVRRAGVSSFGSGGANAHLIVEEAPIDCRLEERVQIDTRHSTTPPWYLITLSAKTGDALRQKEVDFAAWLDKEGKRHTLADMSATLLLGKDHFEVRSAFVVKDTGELQGKLQEVIEQRDAKGYFNEEPSGKKTPRQPVFENVAQTLVNELGGDKNISEQGYEDKLMALAELYAKGYDANWRRFYGRFTPRRINLPPYPFARKSYWITPIKKSTPHFKSSITQQDLLSVPLTESRIFDISAKPGKIVLHSLSEKSIMPEQSTVQATQHITLEVLETPVHAVISTERLRQELTTSLSEILYMQRDDIAPDTQFIDLGMDSIIGVEWMRSLKEQYGISMTATKLYAYPNIREFAEFLSKEINKHEKKSQRYVRVDALPLRKISPELAKKERENTLTVVQEQDESIAIIGMSGRYPQAGNIEQYWENLSQGKNSIREIPESRWDVNQYYDPRRGQKGKIYCKGLGAVDEIECFDPLFFHISPVEAGLMDPQQRLFLQEAYKAFEDAGYSRQSLSNHKCGVYLGIMSNEYALLLSQRQSGAGNITGNSFAIAAARIAYYLNLKGPAIPIDTACSSSLVATHLACQALIHKEINMALVGGVTLYLTPESYLGMCAAGMLAPDGRCKTFDNSADGFVPGEGVGALVLKRLSDAIHDHDLISGVIIGSGINQDGKTNGITAPSISSQMDLEREIYEKYTIHPESIDYVEMHGTGTKLGDPIELEALSTVFRERSDKKAWCAIGSVKSNIGHTSAAAGVASVHKVLLCLKHKQFVPTLNFNMPNEHFAFQASPFYVNTELKPWESAAETPRRAAVSSFGFSGTNAHIVVEEYVPEIKSRRAPAPRTPAIIVLSAHNEERLRQQAQRLLSAIEKHSLSDNDLLDMAYTLQVGREGMEERLAIHVTSVKELEEQLEDFAKGRNNVQELYRGQVKRHKETLAVFAADEDMAHTIDAWIRKGKYATLLDLWVKGLVIEWGKLYSAPLPRRISLPTYPFARERCWLNEQSKKSNSSFFIAHSSLIPHIADKPKGISLPLLSDDPMFPRPLTGDTRSLITISLPYLSFPQLENNKPTSVPFDRLRTGSSQEGNAELQPFDPSIGSGRHQLRTSPVTPVHAVFSVGELEDELITSLADALYMKRSDIDLEKEFIDLGLDSIIGIEWIQALKSQYGLSIQANKTYEYPTIRAFARFLAQELNTQGNSSLNNPVPSVPEVSAFHPIAPQKQDNSQHSSNSATLVQEKVATQSLLPNKPVLPSLRQTHDTAHLLKRQDVAIIGLSGRYPQAKNLQKFWENLRDGKDCITEIPKDRWDHDRYFDEERNKFGKTYSKWGGFLEDVDHFEPLFFNISPREAELIDPKERLFLETVWDLLERAGYTRETLHMHYQNRVGVYVGAMYQQYHAFDSDLMKESVIALSSHSSIANRVSYFFNFQGPSVAIDTACSSALIALHMACQSLMTGECQIAIAGAVNLSIHPKKYLGLSSSQMLGSRLDCRSFGDSDGFFPAEGVGAVFLKPLAHAIRDQDDILAVIKTTAINHDGHTRGMTVPNPNAQARLCEENFTASGLDPRTISYVEAAASGFPLGDALEIKALTKAFRKSTADRQFCAIGSVKSNIGHAEAASGMAQLTKVVLQFQHKELIPSIKAEPLNPNIRFENTPFYLQQALQEWKRPVLWLYGSEREVPRRATVSSFGAGGSNAHVILEEYIPPYKAVSARTSPALSREQALDSSIQPQIVVFSARTSDRLQAVIQQMFEYLERHEDLSVSDFAYTLQIGREAMDSRVAMIVRNREELVMGLKTYLNSLRQAQDTTQDTALQKHSALEVSIPIFNGNSNEDRLEMKHPFSDKASETMLQTLLAENSLEKLARYWTQGGQVFWEALHKEDGVRRICLPTYPFARKRYWISEVSNQGAEVIHPLLHHNTSDLSEQRFSSTFSGQEFFFADHLVHGQRVLPGAASLEMARAAVQQAAAATFPREHSLMCLKNVVWTRPVVVDHHQIRIHNRAVSGRERGDRV